MFVFEFFLFLKCYVYHQINMNENVKIVVLDGLLVNNNCFRLGKIFSQVPIHQGPITALGYPTY